MGWDFFILWDKGTEVSSLSQDKWTMGQKSLYCPHAKGQPEKLKILPRNRPGWDFDILQWEEPGRNFDSMSCPGISTGKKGKKSKKLQFLNKKINIVNFFIFLKFFVNQRVVLSRDVTGQKSLGTRCYVKSMKMSKWLKGSTEGKIQNINKLV